MVLIVSFSLMLLSLIFAIISFLQGMNVHIEDKRVVIYNVFTVVFFVLSCLTGLIIS